LIVMEDREPRGASSLSQLAYATAVRALDRQERSLEELRARTGTLLAAASIVASFLGAQTIDGTNSLGTIEALALVALGVSIGACTYVLLPKQEFVFTLNGIRLYETLYAYRDDEGELHRRLAYWLEGYWRENQAKVVPSRSHAQRKSPAASCSAGPAARSRAPRDKWRARRADAVVARVPRMARALPSG
jgi:hypothetical protein